jgi:hypothetical protein
MSSLAIRFLGFVALAALIYASMFWSSWACLFVLGANLAGYFEARALESAE